jgi:serine/threonine protein kinase
MDFNINLKLSMNLYKFIQGHKDKAIREITIKRIIYQMLKALHFLHKQNILHG